MSRAAHSQCAHFSLSLTPEASVTHMGCVPPDETFDGTWPFAPKFYHGNGFAMHYVDEGEGDPIVLLHGMPTWGYLYRKFIPVLSKTHRVIVPDHMGFGKSETPQDKEYCLRTHSLNLINLLNSLNLDKITFFVQDWGSVIGMHYAIRFPHRVARLMVASPVPLGGACPTVQAQKQMAAKMAEAGITPGADGRLPLAFCKVRFGAPLADTCASLRTPERLNPLAGQSHDYSGTQQHMVPMDPRWPDGRP